MKNQAAINVTEHPFAAVETEHLAKGYWRDETQRVNRMIVESKKCRQCGLNLVYRGLSNMTEHRVYGSCSCGFYKLFSVEKC